MTFDMAWAILIVFAGFLGACLASEGITSGKASDFYVRSLPGLSPGVEMPEMHAGLIEVGSSLGMGDASLFFWHVRAKKNTRRTVVWFNGGPGCSSMDGNLLEIGPFRFDTQSGELVANDGAWSEYMNLLFIDQPFGTGYSDPNEKVRAGSLMTSANAVANFLGKYADIFPEIASTDIYLAGESFAGQYVPYIWKALEDTPDVMAKLGGGISGVILGNPWIDPAHQYLSYSQFIKNQRLMPQSEWKRLDTYQERCVNSLKAGVRIKDDACEDITWAALRSGSSKTCFNIYKVSMTSPYPSCGLEWPSEVPAMKKWLGREDVLRALHGPTALSDSSWNECSSEVGAHLDTSKTAPSITLLPEMLKKYPLMLMIGDDDFICNGLGLDMMVKNLDWNGQVGFPETELNETKTHFGSWQSERNLTVAHVTNGSHMLPVEEPKLSRDLVLKFINHHANQNDEDHDTVDEEGDDNENDDDDDDDDDDDRINEAVRQAYRRAGTVALIVVIITLSVLGCIWWRRGQGLSAKGLVQALLQSNMRGRSTRKTDYVPLQNLGRRPDVIIEEDEEGEFEV